MDIAVKDKHSQGKEIEYTTEYTSGPEAAVNPVRDVLYRCAAQFHVKIFFI